MKIEERARIKNFFDTTANWEKANPVLLKGEFGIEKKTGGELAIKVGDGMTAWNSLKYFAMTESEIKKKFSDIESEIGKESDYLQKQINSIVMESSADGDVSAEVAQARVDANGTTYATLKERLDSTDEDVEKIESVSIDLKEDLSDVENAVFVKNDVLHDIEYTIDSKAAFGKTGNTITIKDATNRALLSFTPIVGKTYRVKFNQVSNSYEAHAVFICDSNNKILNVYDADGAEQGFDKWYDFYTDVTIEEPNAYVVYVQAQYQSKLDVKVNEIEKIDSKEERIIDLTNRVEYLEEKNHVLPKPVLIMRFDAWNTTDGRFELLKQYGFTATVGRSTISKDQNIISQQYGLDMGVYQKYDDITSAYGDDAFSYNPSDEILQAWDALVINTLTKQESEGIFKPTAWLCSKGKSCEGLVTALKKYGVKMASGYMPDLSTTPYITDAFDFNKPTVGLYPSTYDSVIKKLDDAISSGKGFAILTHGIYSTEEEAVSNYGITLELLTSFFELVKNKVDAGELLVLNYRQLYSLYNKFDAEAYDFARIVSLNKYLSG